MRIGGEAICVRQIARLAQFGGLSHPHFDDTSRFISSFGVIFGGGVGRDRLRPGQVGLGRLQLRVILGTDGCFQSD